MERLPNGLRPRACRYATSRRSSHWVRNSALVLASREPARTILNSTGRPLGSLTVSIPACGSNLASGGQVTFEFARSKIWIASSR